MADPYRFGTRSAATLELQQRLTGLGLYSGALDGIFGHATRDAVSAARLRFGLPAGGVDAALLAKLSPRPTLVAVLLPTILKGLLPMNFLSGYRTYIIAGAMLLTGLAGVVGIDIPSFTGQAPGNLVMEALAFFFLRQGLKGSQQ